MLPLFGFRKAKTSAMSPGWSCWIEPSRWSAARDGVLVAQASATPARRPDRAGLAVGEFQPRRDPEQVAGRLGLVHRECRDLFQRHPVVLAVRHDLDHRAKKFRAVHEPVARRPIKQNLEIRHGLSCLIKQAADFFHLVAVGQESDRIHSVPDVSGNLGQEGDRPALMEGRAAGNL